MGSLTGTGTGSSNRGQQQQSRRQQAGQEQTGSSRHKSSSSRQTQQTGGDDMGRLTGRPAAAEAFPSSSLHGPRGKAAFQ